MSSVNQSITESKTNYNIRTNKQTSISLHAKISYNALLYLTREGKMAQTIRLIIKNISNSESYRACEIL